ncbi:MAG: single-stranded nucleic acid binding protein [Oscillospiraceae bacterium]|jgi:spoIIIJ-associated protein|nr:single-stranded nucleic acid binding protein [Oscillospiraceae bacterium]
MNKIFTAKTVEEAKRAACEEFGVSEDKITFEIIEEPKRGLFGKLKGEARVNAVYEPSRAQIAADYIKGILSAMGISVEMQVSESEDGAVIELKGDEIGSVIGRRGDTLDSLQYLASMVCNKDEKNYYRITLDSCGYREKRKETLEELAVKIAKTVLRTGRDSVLEPMNPYERRIIHSAVATVEGVVSHSTGEEPYRRVVISAVNKPVRPKKRADGQKKFPNQKGKKGKPFPQKKRNVDFKTSFEKEYQKPVPKPKPEDSIKSELYGKIELDD